MQFVLNERPDENDIGRVREKLHDYNRPFFENENEKKFVLEARTETGETAGGIVFVLSGEWLRVELLWANEEQRGQGMGTRLLLEAEKKAAEQGCKRAYLTTFSFQARPFYEKHGYEVKFVQRGYSSIVKYHMEKELV